MTNSVDLNSLIFSSPGWSSGRAIVLPPGIGVGVSVGIGGGVSKMLKFYVKVFYVMGKALSGKLSCPCDRSCFVCTDCSD